MSAPHTAAATAPDSSGTTAARQLADFASRTREAGLPDGLREKVTGHLLDLVGNSLAALPERPGAAVRALAEEWGGTPAATAIGSAVRLPAPSAALVNGTLAHTLDFDDTHLPSVLHPSASVLPAALATAEAGGATGARLLVASAVGIEVTCRLGMAQYDEALGNSVFFDRGLHATAICGAIGAAVAAALLRGLDADGICSAIGISASMGAGIIESNRTGGTVKRVHCGWAAHAGVVAADMARLGLTGPPTVLEGRFGFFRAYCGERFDADTTVSALTDGLGEQWECARLFIKPYPCNHFTHAGMDAAMRLRRRGLDPARVAALTLGVPAPVLRTIAEPAAEKARPRSGYHAAFSGPYTVATGLLAEPGTATAAESGPGRVAGRGAIHRGLGVFHQDFTDEAAADPARLALAARVTCVADEECTRVFPHQFPAVLTAELDDGTTMTERVMVNKGSPEHPLTTEELTAKFLANALGTGDEQAVRALADRIGDLAAAPDTTALTRALAAVAPGVRR
ncbi:MmgE/PrpD family protein [Streptomyces tubbatahanensis]|uniref:MmgE/PrpD family protein n=1 Tax=Streptomyces tubbatahanensis TaxID=2923272 RepID=A0ABY3Y1G3_9ACTN|nr:MmgE/PrpD family protein [Streptomyces tubbatahanensis]UNT00678.1 MmgE/PrpD family protein [Streptomyces tubbatahanensis]